MVKQRWPVFLALFLLIIIAIVFIVEFITASSNPSTETSPVDVAQVETFLENANAANGAQLIVQFDCATCHITGAQVGIAPTFEGLAERAATRRPNVSAEAYIYESILNPLAFVVEGYSGAMPENYRERLTDETLGDIMAYLLEQR
jgi:cytochrome c